MKAKMTYLDEEKKYPIVFDLNVMEEIQEFYGSMSKWASLTEVDGEPKIKDLKFGIHAMINEAIDIENEKREEKAEMITPKQVGRLMTEIGLDTVINKIQELTVESTSVGDETGKNE